MLTLPRALAMSTVALLVGVGCAADDDAATGSPSLSSFAALSACALPQPCQWPISSGSPEHADGPRCVIAELAAGRSVAVDTVVVGDGGANDCEIHQELHFFGAANVAYRVWRKQCGERQERVTQRCKLLTRDAYTTCLQKFDETRAARSPTGIECSLPEEWTQECVEVDAPTCP